MLSLPFIFTYDSCYKAETDSYGGNHNIPLNPPFYPYNPLGVEGGVVCGKSHNRENLLSFWNHVALSYGD